MNIRAIKKLISPLGKTPLHPQWLLTGTNSDLNKMLFDLGEGNLILDIGCATKWPCHHIQKNNTYYGIDYYQTASEWYHTKPDIYCNALNLPFTDNFFDVVLLFDVLEHIENSDQLLSEINRVLKPGGKLLMQVPFIYPIHDKPRDFVRYSEFGFEQLATRNHFKIEYCKAVGQPMETAALISNLAASQTFAEWISRRSPLMLLVIFLPFYLLINNILALALSRLIEVETTMPFKYQLSMLKLE